MIFLTAIIRSDTRLRLQFSSALAAGAFTGTGTITVTSQDALGASPTIKARLPVLNTPEAIELVLSVPLVEDGLYTVVLTGIPGADLTTASGTENIRLGTTYYVVNSEINNVDVEAALYGVDLVWTGADYLESPNGDLATVAGLANVHGALRRRLVSEGLPWNADYGTKARNFVDGPIASAPAFRGDILRQMLSDDRVKSASVKLDLSDDFVNDANYFVDIKLIGSSNRTDFSIDIPKE